jgi:predicted HicB family RNase H-like nuclease
LVDEKSGRKKRHKELADAVDGRSLRTTGRTEQFNFRCSEGLKQKAQAAASRADMTLAEWMQHAVEAALAADLKGAKGTGNA